MKPFLKKLLRPGVVIPALLSAGIVAALLTLTDIRKVIALMANFQRIYLLYFLLLMVAYECVRGVQWVYLLHAQQSKTPLRTQIFAFAVSEVTKALPIGNYVQNYLLQVEEGEDFGRTSAATTLIIFIEVAASLLGVVILGDGAWTTWLRIVIPVGALIFAVIAWIIVRLHTSHDPPAWVTRHKALRTALEEFRRFREGARDILHPRTLAIAGGLGAVYLAIAAFALYIVTLGLSIPVPVTGALAAYYLSLAVGLIFPLPVDIGILELGMLGALVAVGVNRNSALGASLANRVLSIASSLVIALVVVAILNGELRKALHSGRQKQHQKRQRQPQGQRKPEQQKPHQAQSRQTPITARGSQPAQSMPLVAQSTPVRRARDSGAPLRALRAHVDSDGSGATTRAGVFTGVVVFGLAALALTLGRRAAFRRRIR